MSARQPRHVVQLRLQPGGTTCCSNKQTRLAFDLRLLRSEGGAALAQILTPAGRQLSLREQVRLGTGTLCLQLGQDDGEQCHETGHQPMGKRGG